MDTSHRSSRVVRGKVNRQEIEILAYLEHLEYLEFLGSRTSSKS